ncbi:MAG: alkaline phosphatase family protein [Bacteroidaceae bacterium]|nr:alkaline phosphatase family protein [Bacteroidaceae bacterium]
MRLKHILTLLLTLPCTLLAAQEKITSPKLLVTITIDQLRSDYMYEFEDLYTPDGFKRLLSGGKVYPNSYYAFENIDRASAAATLATGTNPYTHGIVGERWLDHSSLRIVNCTDDKKQTGLYTNDRVSPTRLKAITLSDEMKRATRGKSQIKVISPYCDIAVMQGGHDANEVLWKNDDTGYWCSSSYYGQFPAWANQINKTVVGRSSNWEPIFPTELYNNFGEEAPKKFNYTFNGKNDIRSYKTSACINDEVNELAIACLRSGDLGMDNITDMLAITYYAGNFNNVSMEDRPIEIQDIYTRLDKNIADLLKELDRRIGMENIIISLSSTGYVVEDDSNDEKYRLPSGTIHMDRIKALLNVYLSAIFGKDEYIDGFFNAEIYLNKKKMEQLQQNKTDLVTHAVEFLKSVDGIEDVFTIYRLGGMLSPELQYVKNGYNAKCSGDIWLRLMPGWKMAKDIVSATNLVRRSPATFPMIIYGQGIEHKVIDDFTPANIMTPELANLLHIRRPNDNCLRIFR